MELTDEQLYISRLWRACSKQLKANSFRSLNNFFSTSNVDSKLKSKTFPISWERDFEIRWQCHQIHRCASWNCFRSEKLCLLPWKTHKPNQDQHGQQKQLVGPGTVAPEVELGMLFNVFNVVVQEGVNSSRTSTVKAKQTSGEGSSVTPRNHSLTSRIFFQSIKRRQAPSIQGKSESMSSLVRDRISATKVTPFI